MLLWKNHFTGNTLALFSNESRSIFYSYIYSLAYSYSYIYSLAYGKLFSYNFLFSYKRHFCSFHPRMRVWWCICVEQLFLLKMEGIERHSLPSDYLNCELLVTMLWCKSVIFKCYMLISFNIDLKQCWWC